METKCFKHSGLNLNLKHLNLNLKHDRNIITLDKKNYIDNFFEKQYYLSIHPKKKLHN